MAERGARRCSAARRSTSPRTARCCTSRCARRAASRSWSTARTSCRTCTPCSTRWPTSPIACAAGRGPGTPASGSATSSTSASAAPTSARRWPTRRCAPYADRELTVRFVSNVDGADLAEATRDLDPAETLFIVASKTFTTLETHDQRARRARVAAGGARATSRRSPSTSWPSPPTPAEGRRVRHRHGQHVRVLGLGRRPLLATTRRSVCR